MRRRALLVAQPLTAAVCELIAIAGLALTPALFFWRILTNKAADVATFPLGDFTELHFPYRHWAAEELAAGRLPTWNPYLSAGHPSLGDIQFGLLYPVGAFFARWYGGDLPVLGLEQQVIVHFSIAAVGAYLLARALGAGRAGSLIAGLAFAYAGYMTSFPVQQVIILQTSVWLPWVTLGIELSFRWRQPLFGVVVAGATTMAALVGHPQTLAYVLGTSAAYGVYRLCTLPSLRGFLGAALGGLIGVALAAPALLPALEHLQLTARTDVGFQFTASGFAPHEVIGLVLPSDLGGRSLYAGVLVLALAVVGVGARRPTAGFWASLAAVGGVLSLGGNAFLYPAAYALLPGMQFFRDHERAALVVSLALAMLAGQGARALLSLTPFSRERDDGEGVPPAAAAVTRALRLALVLAAVFGLAGMALQYPVLTTQGGPRTQLGALADRALLTALFGGLAWALLSAARRPVRGPLLGAGLVALCAVDLWTAGWQLNLAPGSPTKLLRPTPTVEFLRGALGPLERIASEGALPADGNAGALFQLPDVVGNSPLDLDSYKTFGDKVEELQRWRLLAVRFVLTRRKIDDPRLAKVFQEGDLSVYELDPKLRLPRAWLVHRAVVAADRDQELEMARRLKPDEEVVLPLAPGPLDGRPPDRPVAESTDVVIDAYDSERFALRTWSSRDAVLVLSERDYPGWKATLDGKPVDVLRADYALRGIYVPAGRHAIELAFEPPGFALGQEVAQRAFTCAVVLVVLGALAPLLAWALPRTGAILPQRSIAPRRRRRYSPEEPTPA
jgi:hypothetical protein